jgi:hypothetical protein
MTTPLTTPTGRPAPSPSVTALLLRRWPTWLAAFWAALSAADHGDGTDYAVVLPLAAAGYVTVAALGRPRTVWPVLGVLLPGLVALRAAGVDPVPVLAAVATLAAVAGLWRGTLRRSALHLLQMPVALLAITAGVTALNVSPDVGGRVLAVGLIGHAAWDAVLWRADRVISRSFLECCAVYDVLVGVALLVLL